MSDLSTLAEYNKIADLLIEKVSKEDIAECASLLAMNLAHYQSKYGELFICVACGDHLLDFLHS